jgi:glycine cleavage system aminomethyltransferase T
VGSRLLAEVAAAARVGEALEEVMLADGGVAIGDLAVLRDQPDLFGPVASMATAWRVLDAIDGPLLDHVKVARAAARNGRGCYAAKPGAASRSCGAPAWWCQAW